MLQNAYKQRNEARDLQDEEKHKAEINHQEEEINGLKSKTDMLACQKCKQFGHLTYQCMNMIGNKEGNMKLLPPVADVGPQDEEENKEFNEKATELM